jgi:hypothetical protein
MTDIPVPGRPGETIEALTDEEVDDVIACNGDDDWPTSWPFALACEVKMLRVDVAEMQRYVTDISKPAGDALRAEMARLRALLPTDVDRAALSTAAFELKERRNNYAAMLQGFERAGSDPFVNESYRDSVKACDEAVEVCERLAKP